MYEVHIIIWHDSEYASKVLPTSYTDQINEILQRIPSGDPWFRPHFALRRKLNGSTPLSSLRSIIVEEEGIPLTVQSHFGKYGGGGMEPLGDDVDLDYARAFLEDDDDYDNDRVYLCLVTTAYTLRGIFELRPESGDGMVGNVLRWRHFIGGLRYLKRHNNKEKGKDVVTDQKEEEEEDPDKVKRKEYERMERTSAETVRGMFFDWDRLVRGMDQPRTAATEPSETVKAREQDIETRFRQWLLQKKELLAKISANDDSTALPDEQTSSNHRVYSGHLIPDLDSYRDVECRLEFDFPPATEKIAVKPLRTKSGNLAPDSSSFTVRSGVLLWGQLHTVFAGSISSTFQQNAQSVPRQLPGGTIKQSELKYRSAARKGEWKVRKAFETPLWGTEDQPTAQFGWIIYHEAIDSLAAIDRCSRVGVSNGNTHVDKVMPLPTSIKFFTTNPSVSCLRTIIPLFFTLPIGLQTRNTIYIRMTDVEIDESAGCAVHQPL